MACADNAGGTSDRRSFLRNLGVAGFCACGVAGEAVAPHVTGRADAAFLSGGQAAPAAPEPLAKQWIATLLPLLASGDRRSAAAAIRECSGPHYEQIGIQPTLDTFRGNLPGFLDHLKGEWGWVITYTPDDGVILIDENKSKCVCPLVPKQATGDLGLLCYCSEGIAERMFSQVAGAPVRAQVTASILRGDPSCKYRIELKPR